MVLFFNNIIVLFHIFILRFLLKSGQLLTGQNVAFVGMSNEPERLITERDHPIIYEEDGEMPPFEGIDASTLEGHPADDFLLKSEYTPVDLSSYLQTSVADTKYATINHTHSASQITSGTLSVSRGGTGATSLSSLANSLSPYLSGSSGGNIAIAYGTSITASFTIRCAIYTAYYGSVDKCGIWMATESCTRRMGDLSGADVDFTISGRTCNCDTKWVTDPMLVVFG